MDLQLEPVSSSEPSSTLAALAARVESDATWERRWAALGMKRPSREEVQARFEAWKARS